MPTSFTPKKTVLKGDPIRKEARAGAPVTPGQLTDFNGDGELVAHATAGGLAAKAFAAEQDYIGASIDYPCKTGDQVGYNVCRPGDEIFAFLAAGKSVAKGDFLESAGNGALQGKSADGYPLARAIETVDNSAGSQPVRVKVEVL